MEFVDNNEFNDLVEKYKKLELIEKKRIVEEEIKEFIAVLDKLNSRQGKKTNLLFNREILDLKKEDSTEDDFVEAMYVYINSIKELFASLIDSSTI